MDTLDDRVLSGQISQAPHSGCLDSGNIAVVIGDEFTIVDSRSTHGYDCTIETTTKPTFIRQPFLSTIPSSINLPSSPVIVRDVSNRVGVFDFRGGGSKR